MRTDFAGQADDAADVLERGVMRIEEDHHLATLRAAVAETPGVADEVVAPDHRLEHRQGGIVEGLVAEHAGAVLHQRAVEQRGAAEEGEIHVPALPCGRRRGGRAPREAYRRHDRSQPHARQQERDHGEAGRRKNRPRPGCGRPDQHQRERHGERPARPSEIEQAQPRARQAEQARGERVAPPHSARFTALVTARRVVHAAEVRREHLFLGGALDRLHQRARRPSARRGARASSTRSRRWRSGWRCPCR